MFLIKYAGNRGMTQLEFGFDVPGAWGRFPVGKISHNVSLSSCQIHGFQSVGHGLIGAPVQDTQHVSIVVIQNHHLQNEM